MTGGTNATPVETLERACWCGAKQARFLYAMVSELGDSFAAYRCEGCGVAFLHPPPTAARLATAYSAAYYGAGGRKFTGPLGRVVAWAQGGRARYVRGLRKQGSRVLDVGCGNGGFVKQLLGLGLAAEGTEWTEESAARARQESGIAVHVGDLLDLDLQPASYDAIVLWHVFEHLARPAETLDKVRELLAPGGLLFLALPNLESVQAEWFGPHWFHWDPPRHLHNFGRESLRILLESRGFETIRSSTWSFEQNPYGFIQSLLNALGFPRERAYSVLKGTCAAPRLVRIGDAFLLAALAPWGTLAALAETAVRRGATATVVARRGE